MAKRPVATVPAPDKRCETLPGLLKPSTSPTEPCPDLLPVTAAPPGPIDPAPSDLVPDDTFNLSAGDAPTCSEPARSRKTIDWKQTPYAVILGARVLQAVATEAEVLKFIETLTEKQQQKVVVGLVRKPSLTIQF